LTSDSGEDAFTQTFDDGQIGAAKTAEEKPHTSAWASRLIGSSPMKGELKILVACIIDLFSYIILH
jgi:hypothetical protein